MRKPYKLVLRETNPKHTTFTLFDSKGANCGVIIIETVQVKDFIRLDWNGELDWNGHFPNDWREG